MFVKPNAFMLLREERLIQRLTQRELAKKMGFNSPQRLANIEYGHGNLTLENALIAAKALNVSSSLFISDKVKQYV